MKIVFFISTLIPCKFLLFVSSKTLIFKKAEHLLRQQGVPENHFFGNNSKLFKFRKLVRAKLVTAPCFTMKRAWRERAVKVNVLISSLWLLTFLQQRQYWNVRQSKSVELKNVYFLSKKATYLKPAVSINQIYYLPLSVKLIMLRKGDMLSNFEQASLTQLLEKAFLPS